MSEQVVSTRGRITANAADDLIVAIGEMAIKDYIYAIRKHNRLAAERQDISTRLALYRCEMKMQSIAAFFTKDPYDIFQHHGGEEIIKKLREIYKYKPCVLLTNEEFNILMKNI